jgi:hypothetical protein
MNWNQQQGNQRGQQVNPQFQQFGQQQTPQQQQVAISKLHCARVLITFFTF